MSRTARERAIDGLRMIAAAEEYVAAEIDEAGYYGELATHLSDHAAHLRRVASGVKEQRAADGEPARPTLRLVSGGAA